MLRPEMTTIVLRCLPVLNSGASTPARAVALPPSITTPSASNSKFMAGARLSSATSIARSIKSRTIGNVYWLFNPILPPRLSAKLEGSSTVTGLPASRLRTIPGSTSMDTPMTSISEDINLLPKIMPERSPPPDNGAIMVSASGKSVKASNAIVACPAMTDKSS